MGEPIRPQILVVDDNHATQILLRIVLGMAGYDLHKAHDAEEAVAFLKIRPRTELVILDLRMPRHGGVAFLEARAADPQMCMIPIMILSGDSALHEVASRFGIEHYLMKGGKPSHLVDLVRTIVPAEGPRWGA